jgi:hypothetical protein
MKTLLPIKVLDCAASRNAGFSAGNDSSIIYRINPIPAARDRGDAIGSAGGGRFLPTFGIS